MFTPELRSLGRGRGRAARYPAEALTQVLMIGALLTRSRNLNTARWLLFLEGFPVSMRHLRRQLAAVASRMVGWAAEARVASETDDDSVAQRYWDGIARVARKRARSPLVRDFRRLVGRSDTVALLDIIRRFGAGVYLDATPDDRELLSRALTPDVARTFPTTALPSLSGFFNLEAVSAALDRADDDALRLARAEFVRVARLLIAAAGMVPGLGRTLALEMRRDPEWPPPFFFLLWLRHRNHPHARDLLAGVANLSASHFPLPSHGDSPTD